VAYDKKYIKVKLKFRKSKSNDEESTCPWYTVTSLLLKLLKQRFID